MNKQQLAAKIWASANKMRSKIEANEYKDYILGFIFYKFLSDKELEVLRKDGWTEDDLPELKEADKETVKYLQGKLGYFIAYENLFSTWLYSGSDFDVSNVRDALSAFARLINKNHKKVFNKIFHTLDTGLSKLGGTSSEQTKAIMKLLKLIKDIPTDSSQGYDVLGFIYEYLISNFAANAGKKAGEFYTPHEVALLMAEIVADHLKDRKEIQIYDPTSGSGSLLINIGQAIAKHIDNQNNIKYYAQELKENTYNLTRMNLVMRGILPDNIIVRNGDTLEADWPYFEEAEDGKPMENTFEMLHVDAVVSNPPYSQSWEPKNKDADPRFERFGLAPKGKADYAFLLHDLAHIKHDGIVTIVLPHGVLFRGGEDETIRRNLIESNHIDAIIGLPANIFFGTSIATTIMVLKQKRDNEDVLIIDASKGFVKDGKNNKLRACDIRKIADTVIHRKEIPNFSRKVSREIIRQNNYNLNIPRYVDSSEALETWDAYGIMFGGIPNHEIDLLSQYWNTFPSLRSNLFTPKNDTPCSNIHTEDVGVSIRCNSDVAGWSSGIREALKTLPDYLDKRLIGNALTLNVHREETVLANEIYRRIENRPLLDRYNAYQILDDQWTIIHNDLEMLQTEGFQAAKWVDPNMVVRKAKKEEDEDTEVQDGWKGHILPFELVQCTILKEKYEALLQKQKELDETISSFDDLILELPEEEKEAFLNEDNTEFDMESVGKKLEDAFLSIESKEIDALNAYLSLLDDGAKKPEKVLYINKCHDVEWSAIEPLKDGTYSKKNVQKRINELRLEHQFKEGSLEWILLQVSKKTDRIKSLKKEISADEKALHELTKNTIENLTDEQVKMLLREKWIMPLCERLHSMSDSIIDDLRDKVTSLATKYETGLVEVEQTITGASKSLSLMLNELTGTNFDLQAYKGLKNALLNSSLEFMKMASLEKMFPQPNETTPQVRFKGFKGEWKEQKLSDCLSVYLEKNEQERYTKYDIYSVSNEYGVINQIKYQGKSLAGASLKNYKVTHRNNIIYTKSPLKNQPYGIIKTNHDTSGIVSALYAVYQVKDGICPDFIQVYFSSDKRLNGYLRTIVNKGAKNTLLVSDEGALSGTVVFPADEEEQIFIANFFSCLDTLISAQEQKLDKLRSLKKSFLEKMFVSTPK